MRIIKTSAMSSWMMRMMMATMVMTLTKNRRLA